MSMQPLTLKKTCDTCTKSKVKCSGGYPCTRCQQKGIQCFYSPRKKRGAPKKDKVKKEYDNNPIVVRSEINSSAKGSLATMADHERRSWSVFFTLYKHYATSCSLFWFNQQLKKMQNYLNRRGDKAALERLTTWMDAISVDIDTLTEKMNKCKLKMLSSAVIHPPGAVALRGIRGTVKDPDQRQIDQLQALLEDKKNSKTPFIRIRTKFIEGQQEGVEIICNEAFTLVFGHTADNLEKELNWSGGGLLPWGGDVLGRLLTKEKDLLAFVQILAIKFNNFGVPKEIPCIREIPSCHMMEVEIKDNPRNGQKVSVDCLIKCVHREELRLEGSTLDISIDLTPLAPHDHLLDQDRITTQVELERPADIYRLKRRAEDGDFGPLGEDLKKPKDVYEEEVVPQAEDVRIREIPEVELKANQQKAEEQYNIRPLQKPNESKEILKGSKGVFMSEIDEFLAGEMAESTENEYLNFDDSEKADRLDDALEVYVGEDDYNIEDDWFEGLLDWSSQSTVPTQYRPSALAVNGDE